MRQVNIFLLLAFQAKDQRSEFDAETAIRVCRQAGYFSQALRLAEDRQKHDWYLNILMEDTCDYKQALEYIRKLPVEQVGHLWIFQKLVSHFQILNSG